MAEIGLADVVRGLREELDAAMTAGDGQHIQFELSAIELEFPGRSDALG